MHYKYIYIIQYVAYVDVFILGTLGHWVGTVFKCTIIITFYLLGQLVPLLGVHFRPGRVIFRKVNYERFSQQCD